MSWPTRRRHRRIALAVVALATLPLASCARPRPPAKSKPPATSANPPPLPSPANMPQADLGLLPVFVTEQSSDGRVIQVRGLIGNPYPEPVDGVRVIVRILLAPRSTSEEVDRFQKEYRTRIASGERTALRLDIRTPYARAEGTGGIFLQAFAIRRGSEYLPMPPDWR
ncbi:hypothetical protein L6Q96_12545 [Candidatus Binatia bacterium]|nr:hypothetical protein [Candidatus Binatia bacterium]